MGKNVRNASIGIIKPPGMVAPGWFFDVFCAIWHPSSDGGGKNTHPFHKSARDKLAHLPKWAGVSDGVTNQAFAILWSRLRVKIELKNRQCLLLITHLMHLFLWRFWPFNQSDTIVTLASFQTRSGSSLRQETIHPRKLRNVLWKVTISNGHLNHFPSNDSMFVFRDVTPQDYHTLFIVWSPQNGSHLVTPADTDIPWNLDW